MASTANQYFSTSYHSPSYCTQKSGKILSCTSIDAIAWYDQLSIFQTREILKSRMPPIRGHNPSVMYWASLSCMTPNTTKTVKLINEEMLFNFACAIFKVATALLTSLSRLHETNWCAYICLAFVKQSMCIHLERKLMVWNNGQHVQQSPCMHSQYLNQTFTYINFVLKEFSRLLWAHKDWHSDVNSS